MADLTTLPTKGQTEMTITPERTRGGVCFTPRVDIVETAEELTLYADLPGVRPENVDLQFENGELVLTGRVQPRHEGRGFLLAEYEVGDFYRAFTISEQIDGTKIEAEFKNGVLTVHLPKMEQLRPRKITVRGT